MKSALRAVVGMFPGAVRDERKRARALFLETMERARGPVFFTRFAVADTIDGRFDLVALHAWLVLDWLGKKRPALSQAFIDEVFLGFDEALRELGTGDVGMTRRLKTLANAFYGRLRAYGNADSAMALAAAIQRNVYRDDPSREGEATALATYAWTARSHLRRRCADKSAPDFGPLPA